jgi:hypothetical protein
MLRAVHRLLLAIVTVLVCAGCASPGAAQRTLFATAVDAAVAVNSGAEQASDLSYLVRDRARPADVELRAVESDVDDDPLCEAPHETLLSVRAIPMPDARTRAWRGELPVDPSQWATDACLPRGPPA